MNTAGIPPSGSPSSSESAAGGGDEVATGAVAARTRLRASASSVRGAASHTTSTSLRSTSRRSVQDSVLREVPSATAPCSSGHPTRAISRRSSEGPSASARSSKRVWFGWAQIASRGMREGYYVASPLGVGAHTGSNFFVQLNVAHPQREALADPLAPGVQSPA